MTEFNISKTEIARRSKAFDTLIVFLLLGFAIPSLVLCNGDFTVTVSFLAGLAVIFIVFRALIARSFNNFQQTQILLSEHLLKRTTPKTTEEVKLSEVTNIEAVATTGKYLREVRISTVQKKLVLDGLEDFDRFLNQLSNSCPGITVVKKREPIAYDHPAFYIILGLVVGVLSAIFLRSIQNSNLGPVYYVVSILSLGLGLYFLIDCPLTQRYGHCSRPTDIIIGFLFLAAGLTILLLYVL